MHQCLNEAGETPALRIHMGEPPMPRKPPQAGSLRHQVRQTCFPKDDLKVRSPSQFWTLCYISAFPRAYSGWLCMESRGFMGESEYSPQSIEKKWQDHWLRNKTYK